MIELAVALAMGGVTGAGAAVVYQATQLPNAFDRLSSAVETSLVGREDEISRNVRKRLTEFRRDFGPVMAAIDKLRRFLRIRS